MKSKVSALCLGGKGTMVTFLWFLFFFFIFTAFFWETTKNGLSVAWKKRDTQSEKCDKLIALGREFLEASTASEGHVCLKLVS